MLVATDPAASGVFNLGSGRPRTIRETVELARDRVDPALPLGFGEVPFRPDQVMHLEADVTRLRDTVGWTPKIDLPVGLDQTVAWFRAHERR